MTNNIGITQVAPGQNNKEQTINTALGRYDAAMTAELSVSVDNSNAASVTADQLQQANAVRLVDGSPVPTGAVTITIGVVTRGTFSVFNDTSFEATVEISGQSKTPPKVGAGESALLYVDGSNVQGVSAAAGGGGGAATWLEPARVAATSNVDISTALEAGDVVDGVTLAEGDRVLLTGQTDATENGVYAASASGAASRAADLDEDSEVVAGVAIRVNEGTAEADTTWYLTSDDPLVVGTDDLTFEKDSGGASDFLSLTDTPSSYLGEAGKLARVNSGETAMEFVSDGVAAVNEQTGATYTLALSDTGAVVERNNASANTVTIPAEASVNFEVGAVVGVVRTGAGETTVTAAAGVTLNGVSGGSVVLKEQWRGVGLYKSGADEWVAEPVLGTMASQDADNVAITGGAIDGTPIGGTTPAAGDFTTVDADSYKVGGVPAATFIAVDPSAGAGSCWRYDGVAPMDQRNNTISSISGDTITLPSANDARDFFEGNLMNGVVYVRIWNTTKNPDESAWVKAVPDWGTNKQQLQVTDSADISGWSNGETIQLGETSPSGHHVVAVDPSPMMTAQFGTVFAQQGMFFKTGLKTTTQGDKFDISPDGTDGSYTKCGFIWDVNEQTDMFSYTPCSDPSPISAANLFYVRDLVNAASTINIQLLSCTGMLS